MAGKYVLNAIDIMCSFTCFNGVNNGVGYDAGMFKN